MASNSPIDQLVLIIVAGEQTGKLAQQLVKHQFYFTQLDSTGGLLPESSVCLLVGIEGGRRPALIRLIQRCCKRRSRYISTGLEHQLGQALPVMIEAQVGGALVYSLEVEHFERF